MKKKQGSRQKHIVKFMNSIATRLSIFFMVIVAVVVLFLTSVFVMLLKLTINYNQSIELEDAANLLCICVDDINNLQPELLGIPYYMTYTIYEEQSGDILFTNDPFLPLLQTTHGRAMQYYQKDFFADGDLNILYYAMPILDDKGDIIIIETAMDIERDSSLNLIKVVPKLELITMIPIFIISFCISIFITRLTLRPVKRITDQARKISSTNLEQLLPVSNNNNEIDELAKTFNSLFESLRTDFDRERNFTSNVSHELKTPVAGILGQAKLLKRWGKEDPKQLETSLNMIITEANSMNAIITNLLQISKLEAGYEKPLSEPLYIQTMFLRLKNEFETISPNVHIDFSSDDDVLFNTDIELLHQVLTALISNSIKFSKDQCHIALKAETQSNLMCIYEIDDGPGFTDEVLPHIFERFYRGDPAHSRAVGGAGLGLSISSSIVKALGGTITANNREDGHTGAVITLMIPLNC